MSCWGMATALRPWSDETLRSFPPDQRYLVGVSGGRDSVALLHWLLGLGYGKLIVCHLDHQLRGRSSTADARFVEQLAAANDLTFEVGATDVRQLAAETKQSVETAGRDGALFVFCQSRAAPPLPHDSARTSRGRSRRNFPDQSVPRGRRCGPAGYSAHQRASSRQS